MKMNILLVQLLSYVLLVHCAQSTLSETCAGLQNLSTCKFKFSVPTGFTVNTKEVTEKKMDVPMYAKIIAGMKSCEKGSCNSTQVIEAIQYVFGRFRDDINSGFTGILTEGCNVKPMSYVSLAQAQVESINASCEKLGSCKVPAVSSFMEQVNSNIAAASYLGNLRFPADIGGKLNNLLQRQANASSQANDLLDEAATVALFKNGKVKAMKDLFQFLPMIKRVKDLSNDIKTQLDPFKEFLPNNLTFAISTQELNVSEKGENGEVLEKLEAMQELISKNYDGNYLTRVTASIGSTQGQLSYLSAMNGKFVIETDIVTFEQWSKLPTMAMPCSKMVDKTYKDSGFKEAFSYPEYSKCTVDGMTAKFPDLQIGYFRWSF
ncbi:hypothetical protein LZL87_006206 [Fusarium oxysporum]|nr:hypothetical protein LZL87_006206 [Fusarium oxysporum]